MNALIKLAFLLLILLAGSSLTQAQWTTDSSNNIYYNAGKVGIGTSGPGVLLDVEGGGMVVGTTGGGGSLRTLTILNSGQGLINYGSYPYEWSPAFQIQNNDNTKFVWLSAGGSGSYSSYNARLYTKGSGLDFFTGNPGSELFAATIASNGNFGIGASAPAYRLEVNGNARTASTLYVDGDLTGTGAWGVPNVYLDTLNSKSTNDPLEINYRTVAPTVICASVGCATFSAYFSTNGNVGIGTNNPVTKLHTKGNGFFESTSLNGINVVPGQSLQTIQSDWNSGGADTPILVKTQGGGNQLYLATSGSVGIGTNNPSSAYKLDVNGDVRVSGNIAAKYQDVAEWVPASEQLSAGTVVVLDATKSNQVTSSSVSYDTRVAGVVSEQPGIALGEKSEGKVLVATTGRVRVKVDASKRPIHVGDLLVTSDVPGVAMKSEPVNLSGVQFHRPGTLIGKALEPLEKGKGEILVLLSLQ